MTRAIFEKLKGSWSIYISWAMDIVLLLLLEFFHVTYLYFFCETAGLEKGRNFLPFIFRFFFSVLSFLSHWTGGTKGLWGILSFLLILSHCLIDCLFVCVFVRSFIHLIVCSFHLSLVCLFICSFIHLYVHSFIRLFICLFIYFISYLFVCLFFIHLFLIYSFVHFSLVF